jgi:hypothetical protein
MSVSALPHLFVDPRFDVTSAGANWHFNRQVD